MCSITYSQSLKLFDVNASNFPTIQGKFYSFDAQGRQLRPSVSDLTITENGITRTISSVTCPTQNQPRLSVVLLVDVTIYNDISNTKMVLNSWVNQLGLGANEVALVTYDGRSYINQDFTTDRTKLQNSINALQTLSSSEDHDGALQRATTGGIAVAGKGRFKKIVLLLSSCSHFTEVNIQPIITKASQTNVSLNFVIFDLYDWTPNLTEKMALSTGGFSMNKIPYNDIQSAQNALSKIYQVAQGGDPCTIEWQSNASCGSSSSSVELRSIPQNVTANATFMLPNSAQASLDITPLPLRFDNPQLGVPTVQTLTITASNSSFSVSNIVSSNPAFTVSPTSFTLQPNQSQDVDVTFTAIDSGYNFTKLSIENNICEQTCFVSGGYKNRKPITQTFKLTFPNGGESFIVGSDSIIRWEGIPSNEIVQLEYSTNNGSSWNEIDSASGLSYTWNNIPRPVSTQCLVRAKHLESYSQNNSTSILTIRGHSDDVTSVTFSPDGKILASGSLDSSIVLWDPINGQKLTTLKENISIADIAFSPDGINLASCGSNPYISIWYVWRSPTITGQRISSLFSQYINIGQVSNVAFSPVGSRLASAGIFNSLLTDSSSIKIWDPSTSFQKLNIQGHRNRNTYGLTYSPNGNTLASGSGDSTIILWNPNNGQQIRTLRGHTAPVLSVVYSPDGYILASCSSDGTIILWDPSNGQQIRTLRGHTAPVLNVAISPDGNTLASCSNDSTIILWNTNTGQQIRTLRGHTAPVLSVSFSPDNNTLASGSSDSTIMLWELDVAPIQQDQSDRVFSIVDPMPSSQNIIMGEALRGSSKDSVVVDFVKNTGTWKYSVDSIFIRGADAGAFSLISGTPPYTIEPNRSHFSEFRFTPTKVGAHLAEIMIITQSDTLIQTISGIGVEQSIEVIGQTIDFGVLEVGKLKDTLQTVTIRNSGSVPITILGTTHSLPNTTDFTTISGGGSFTLAPNETHLMDLRFTVREAGRTSGTLVFTYNGVGSPAIVQLFGEGMLLPTSLKVSNTEAYPSDEIEIPIKVTDAQNLFRAGIAAIDVVLSFNPSILYPKGYSVTAVNDTLATITVNNLLVNNPSGISEIRIPFVVMLGNADSCTLGIEQVIPQGGTASINTYNGVFTLLGICREGGTRFVLGNSLPFLVKVIPNPSDGNVEIDVAVIEKGTSTMRIFSSNGTLMEEHRFTTLGNKKIAIDSRAYNDGVYFITLQTPSTFDTAKLLIVK